MGKQRKTQKRVFLVLSIALVFLVGFCIHQFQYTPETQKVFKDLSEKKYKENAHAVSRIMMKGFQESEHNSYARALEDVYHNYNDQISTYVTAKSQVVDYWDFLDRQALEKRKAEVGEKTSAEEWNQIHDQNKALVKKHLPNAVHLIENERAIAAHSFKRYRVIYYNSGNFDLEPV